MRWMAEHKRLTACVLALVLILGCVLSVKAIRQNVAAPPLIDFTVVIDAGHGGIDGGVVGKQSGVKESHLNLIYAKLLSAQFERAGFRTVMTREGEGGLYGAPTSGFKRRDMEKRKEIIQSANADVVVSLHMNRYGSPGRSGPQVFYQVGSAEGQKLAERIQDALNRFTGNHHAALAGDYYVLRVSDCPAVIVECGFLSNAQEEALLQQSDYQAELVNVIFDGIMLYLYGVT